MAKKQIENEKRKALGEVLIAECRDKNCSIASVQELIERGADIFYKNCRCLHWAAKNLNFSVVELLLDNGILLSQVSSSIVTNMCFSGGYNDEMDQTYFHLLERLMNEGYAKKEVLTPYFNSIAVYGRLDKLQSTARKYSLTDREMANCLYIRAIFEVVTNCNDDILDFINENNDWINEKSLALAKATNEFVITEYIEKKLGKVKKL